MKTLILSTVLLVGSAGVMVAYADQPMDSDTSHPGAYVSDSAHYNKSKSEARSKAYVDPDEHQG